MRISDLTQEERKALEAHIISTYRYDEETGKLINRKWNREYPGMIDKLLCLHTPTSEVDI